MLLALFLVSFLLVQPVSAFFTETHEYITVKAFQSVNSAITDQCSDRLQLIIDGNTAADLPVTHYYDNKFKSYVSTHTKGSGFDACLNVAGSDPDLRCFCYGVALHVIQDHYAHTENGVVPKYLSRSLMPNLGGHMTIEKDFDDKMRAKVKADDPSLYTAVQNYNTHLLDAAFEDEKYLTVANDMTGLDMRNDLNIFVNGYKNKGFADTVYGQKVMLPTWFYWISYGALILGLGMFLIILIFGKTGWKWLAILPWIVLAIIGAILIVAFLTHYTWLVVSTTVGLPAKVGIMSVSSADINSYYDAATKDTEKFLETGVLPYDDSTGLSYSDVNGKWVNGELIKSERGFMYVLLPVLAVLFTLLNIFLLFKTFGHGKKKKRR